MTTFRPAGGRWLGLVTALALPGIGLAAGVDAADATDAASTAGAGGLEEIIVTVQRRSERLVDVPIAIASVTAADLEQASVIGLFDLSTMMPGVRIDHYGAYAQPTIRGIGTQDVQGPGANANVAIYVDGFYMPSQAGNIFEFANIERVDVLKGPQGTLFGQNATGGAIVITTADPSFTPTGKISVGAGSFDEWRATFYGSTGLTETIAADLSLYYRDTDSYFDNISTGEPTAPIKNKAARSKILWQPSESMRWILGLEYTDIDDATGLAENTIDPIAAFYHDAFGVPMVHTLEPYDTSLNQQSRANPETYSATLKGEFDLDAVTLTSLTQYRDQDTGIVADLDGTTVRYWQLEYDEQEETFTQEFNLEGAGEGRLDWVAGVFYYHDVGQLRNNAFSDIFNTGTNTTQFGLYSDVEVTTDSIAGFADGTYALTDRLWLTAGVRYTSEEKSLDSQSLLDPSIQFSDSTTWDKLTPRAAIRYALSDYSNLYASYGEGFMSGNYSYTTVGPQEPVDPEEVTQYEVGYKYARGAWSVDAATFFSDYRDLQVYRFFDDCGCYRVDNAPKAESYGAELHVNAAVTEGFTVSGAVAYTHARYKDYVGAGLTGGPVLPPNYGLGTVPTQFADGEMIRAPDWTANLGFNYSAPTQAGTIGLSGNYFYTSEVPLYPGNQLSQDAYGLLSLRASWTTLSDAWTFSVYGNNLTDEEYLIFNSGGFLGNNHIYGAPATWGAQVDFNF
jgi:iron complex outermembrane receptor protein